MWDSSWELVCTFVSHCGAVTSLVPYPYGPMVVSGSSDATIRVWNLATCDQVEVYVMIETPIKNYKCIIIILSFIVMCMLI